MKKSKIVVIDKQMIFREVMKNILEQEGGFQVVGEGTDVSEIPVLYEKYEPDIFLFEFNTTDTINLNEMQGLIQENPESKFIPLTIHDNDPYVTSWFRAGVSGYLLKEMDGESIIRAIDSIERGESYVHQKVMRYFLSDYNRLIEKEHKGHFVSKDTRKPFHLLTVRECEVLQLLTNGNSNRSIAEKLFISEKTVKNHVSSVLFKMNAADRTNAVVMAIKNGWVEVR